MNMKFSTLRTHAHQSEEVCAGRDTLNRLKNTGKVITSARGLEKTATNTFKSQIFVRYLILYFRTFKKSAKFNTG